jgi:hypothetical protein
MNVDALPIAPHALVFAAAGIAVALLFPLQAATVGAGSNMLSFGRFQNADGSEVALA